MLVMPDACDIAADCSGAFLAVVLIGGWIMKWGHG